MFDWGPAAQQHVLFKTGLYAGMRHAETKQAQYLLVTGLCAGLGVWNKALFLWLLGGLAAALAFFPAQVWRVVKRPWLGAPAQPGGTVLRIGAGALRKPE